MAVNTLWNRTRDTVKMLTVEPFLFFILFGYNVRHVTLQSLLHDRACRVSLDYGDDVCDHLDDKGYETYQVEAVKYGNNVYNAQLMCSTIPALVMAIFIGSWSDKHSRKYPLILTTSGILVDATLQAILTSFTHASPYLYAACATISGFSGSFIIIFSSCYSYISDISDERSRQTRFAILEFFSMIGTPIGSFVGGKVFSQENGTLIVMIIGPCSFAIALLWVTFWVAETKPKRSDTTRRQMLQDIFTFDNLKESYQTSIQKREGNLRLQIWLLIAVNFSIRLISWGIIFTGFSYARNTFKWDVERYSHTTMGFDLLKGFATLFVVPILNRRLLVHEAAVGLIGVLSLMSQMIIMSVTVFEGLIFYALFAGMLYACGGIAVRSRLSKLVSSHESGKVFSLLATCEAPTPVLGTIFMTQIYNSTIHIYPGLVYAVSAVMLFPAAIIFAWMIRLPTMSFTQYQESEDEKRMKELKDITENTF